MKSKNKPIPRALALGVPFLVFSTAAYSQAVAPAPAAPDATVPSEEEITVLSPFEVTSEGNEGYAAATTLAGNRLNTELRDVGNAVTVINQQFLRDIGATNNTSLLQYTTNTEVGSIQGNFAGLGDGSQLNETGRFKNPSANTRVRGLAEADNARDFFLSSIPWDSYNLDRVDLQRGPNSIMFGQGSPAGLINAGTQSAAFKNSNEVDLRFGTYGTNRQSINLNRVLIKDQLAIRFAALREEEKYRQKPAFERDDRLYGAVRFEPAFLKQGGARTILKANIEKGDIIANRPRTLPPYDQITPWFRTGTYQGRRPGDANGDGRVSVGELAPYTFNNLNKLTLNPHQAMQDNLLRPNHGQNRPSINGGPYQGTLNPSYQPWIQGGMGATLGASPWAFLGETGNPVWWSAEPSQARGINSVGGEDRGVGFNFNRPVTVASMASWAKAAGVDYAEIYKNQTLTDASVYDFYNNLMDGPNKSEWQDWESFNVSLAQTFFKDKVGFEFIYNSEHYSDGQLSLMRDAPIFVDVMSNFADGTQAGTGTPPNNIPYGDGTPNPNVGRAYVTDSGQFGNNSFKSDREGRRATAFVTHDFERESNTKNYLTRFLGKHTLTGLWSSESQETDNRNWQRYAILDQSFRTFQGLAANTRFNSGDLAPSVVYYLGDSMMGANTASGANLSRINRKIDLAGTYNVRAFDSTWAPPAGVNPGDPWLNPAFLAPEFEYPDYDPTNPNAATLWPDRRITTQSENPLNYRGWTDLPITVTGSETTPGGRDLLANDARLTRAQVDSRALVWQGKMMDNAIVGTFGWRQDRAKSWSYTQSAGNRDGFGHMDFSPAVYRLPYVVDNQIVNRRTGGNAGSDSYNALERVTSRAYSVVAHLNDLPFIKEVTKSLPINVSLLYAHSSNFQPLANRVDFYGEPIGAPEGKTYERGILFETKDGKYTLKINQYKTSVTNANSSGLAAWFLGASQAWAGNWANRFQYNWDSDNVDRAVAEPQRASFPDDAAYQTAWDRWNYEGSYNYGTAAGETRDQAKAREAAAVAAWRAWQQKVDPRFYSAWQMDLNRPFTPGTGGLSQTTPAGFTVTEDTSSKGYEIELSAMPTRNWRVAVNASQTKASRQNIGGAALASFIDAYTEALRTTPAGDLRIWWGGAGNETTLFQWNQNIAFDWTSRKLQEGTRAPEIREWRFNAITNYDFDQGFMKGFNVGLGVRYQDDVIIGYTPVGGSENYSVDLSRPYRGPAETNFDFWVGYQRRIYRNVDWRIQLNVQNAFEGKGLIPISTQPDGSVAAYRIAPSQLWTISNTFRF